MTPVPFQFLIFTRTPYAEVLVAVHELMDTLFEQLDEYDLHNCIVFDPLTKNNHGYGQSSPPETSEPLFVADLPDPRVDNLQETLSTWAKRYPWMHIQLSSYFVGNWTIRNGFAHTTIKFKLLKPEYNYDITDLTHYKQSLLRELTRVEERLTQHRSLSQQELSPPAERQRKSAQLLAKEMSYSHPFYPIFFLEPHRHYHYPINRLERVLDKTCWISLSRKHAYLYEIDQLQERFGDITDYFEVTSYFFQKWQAALRKIQRLRQESEVNLSLVRAFHQQQRQPLLRPVIPLSFIDAIPTKPKRWDKIEQLLLSKQSADIEQGLELLNGLNALSAILHLCETCPSGRWRIPSGHQELASRLVEHIEQGLYSSTLSPLWLNGQLSPIILQHLAFQNNKSLSEDVMWLRSQELKRVHLIPAGSCYAGPYRRPSPVSTKGVKLRQIRVDNDFWCSVYPWTKQLQAEINVDHHIQTDKPLEPYQFNTLFDALQVCNQRSQKEGLKPVYTIIKKTKVQINPQANGWRLPTEIEWEYAARAFTEEDPFPSSDQRVGQGSNNAFGLHDMVGYHLELCIESERDPQTNQYTLTNYRTRGGRTIWKSTDQDLFAIRMIRSA